MPGADQVEDLTLAAGQPERVLPRCRAGPGRDGPDTELSHLLPGEPDRGCRAEVGEDPRRVAQCSFVGRPGQGPARALTGCLPG
jgi:hypothetical protein